MKIQRFIVLYVLLFSPQLMASSAYLSFSESSAEFGLSTGGDYTDTVDFGMTGYYNNQQDLLITLDMLTAIDGDSASPWLFSLGANAFGMLLKRQPDKRIDDTEDEGYIGVAVSLQLGYKFLTAIPIATIADLSYSPDILNNGDIKTVLQAAGYIELMLSPSAIAQVGYRHYRADLASGHLHLGEEYKTFEDNIIMGIKLRF